MILLHLIIFWNAISSLMHNHLLCKTVLVTSVNQAYAAFRLLLFAQNWVLLPSKCINLNYSQITTPTLESKASTDIRDSSLQSDVERSPYSTINPLCWRKHHTCPLQPLLHGILKSQNETCTSKHLQSTTLI
jgi:hypothetical protein